ncbi:DNA-binding GntR family transcriptional regulator [Streptosporangium becharense]|uniref:DNA-binding GntR family transcriptional regulator n=1 Tax=Streptosporangium becharense TaxID=1816182 RepID=A0A7W9MHR6_9ACTN|nr:winged helix-turn-helix domain-containing protein [Streptosporangium becharense]MBB2912432.1 DNA-binding GntR family transcriptional regulator [Streptosporangium becharense]MBB5820739.1 DNA-binding GntR family transcriptional regulator [Streptosporangium becharense]
MTELRDDLPRWRQVRDIIVQRIEAGQYRPGQRIPSVVDLTQEFGIATQTAQKVMNALRKDRWIRTERGMGSFVTTEEERAAESNEAAG